MIIRKEHIENQRKLVENLEGMKYIHFRDLYPNIDSTNFQICTKVDFKAIEDTYENIRETWGRLKHESTVTYEFTSKTGSQYFMDDKDNVYRLSNHWGAVASCEWTREGKGNGCHRCGLRVAESKWSFTGIGLPKGGQTC